MPTSTEDLPPIQPAPFAINLNTDTSDVDLQNPSLRSSYREFVLGLAGVLTLLILTSVMSVWLVYLQSLRAENSEIIVTPFPSQYKDQGADKVVRPCVTPFYHSQLPKTEQCTYTYGQNVTVFPDTYCPKDYYCDRVWDSSVNSYVPGSGCYLNRDPEELEGYTCSPSCNGQDYLNLPYYGPNANVISYGFPSAPVSLFVFFASIVLFVILVVLYIQYRMRQTENATRYNIALGISFLVGGALILLFGGIAVLIRVPAEDYYDHPTARCVGSSELQHQVSQMVTFSDLYITWFSFYCAFYCLTTLVVVGFFIYYMVACCKGDSATTVEDTL